MASTKRINRVLEPMSVKEFATWYGKESKRDPNEIMHGTRGIFLEAVWNAWTLGVAYGAKVINSHQELKIKEQ